MLYKKKKVRHLKNCHLHTCHLHNDKAENGTSKQPDKAPVTKERRCGRSLTQETLGIIRGVGVQTFRPTHPAEDLPTQTPRPPLQNSSYKRCLMCACAPFVIHDCTKMACDGPSHVALLRGLFWCLAVSLALLICGVKFEQCHVHTVGCTRSRPPQGLPEQVAVSCWPFLVESPPPQALVHDCSPLLPSS